jgi:hypothetical protein
VEINNLINNKWLHFMLKSHILSSYF